MKVRPILTAMVAYTILAGILTVSSVYLISHSGLYILATGGIGILLVVLGGAEGGAVSASTVEGAEDLGISAMMVEDMQLRPTMGNHSTRLILIFYGFGLLLWSGVVIVFLSSGLQ